MALTFTCPRCGTTTEAVFYGPCSGCREQLRATMRGEQRAVEAGLYEPKANVTPNAVAQKD